MENIKLGEGYAYLVPYLQPIQYKEKMPTMIVCPGGAYFYTSQREAEPVAIEFLAKGYNVFVLHYSTMVSKRIQEEGLGYEEARLDIEDIILGSDDQPSEFPNPLVELALAMKYINDNAELYHVDTDNIVTIGFSAGANLVSLLGVYWNEAWLYDLVGTTKEVLRPKAQILAYGYYDSLKMFQTRMDGLDALQEALIKATFNMNDLSGDELISVSPTLLANTHVPPSFVWHTRQDDLVPVEQSMNFCLALEEHGVPWELHVFDQGDHGLSVASDVSMSKNDHAHNWVHLAHSWLKTYIEKEQ